MPQVSDTDRTKLHELLDELRERKTYLDWLLDPNDFRPNPLTGKYGKRYVAGNRPYLVDEHKGLPAQIAAIEAVLGS